MAAEKQTSKEKEHENKDRKPARSEAHASQQDKKSQAKANRQGKMSTSKLEPGKSGKTIDHNVIRHWVEERGGRPATVKATEGKSDPGLLRIDFPDRGAEDRLDDISWEEFFDKFEEKKLAFLYQEETRTGRVSRFSKFVSRGKEE